MSVRLPDPRPNPSRRQLVVGLGALVLLAPFAAPLPVIAAAPNHVKSVAVLKNGIVAERNAHQRYVEFGQHAKSAGYRGLAYLYTALATSEMIHEKNYVRVLASLGVQTPEQPPAEIPLGTAKQNLLYAAERELSSIEDLYPGLLRTAEAEGHSDTITVIRYSWESHKQHLDIIEKIQRWSPGFFESVAKKIDESADRYFVCQVCGSTVTEIPAASCPVCNESASNYQRIADDRFF